MKYCALTIAIALVGVALSFAQTSTTRSITNLPPGWVDGSKNPGGIPDRAAYRLTFIHLMLPPSPDAAAAASQEASIKRIGLSGADEAVLKQAVATFAAGYLAWKQTPGATGAQAWTLVQTTRSGLQTQLSPDGNSKFSAYVALAKMHMVVKP